MAGDMPLRASHFMKQDTGVSSKPTDSSQLSKVAATGVEDGIATAVAALLREVMSCRGCPSTSSFGLVFLYRPSGHSVQVLGWRVSLWGEDHLFWDI